VIPAQPWLNARREQSDWLEDVLAGLLINGVAQDDIEILYFTQEPGRCVVRKSFPDKFDRMAKLARDLDVRLCRMNDERRFIDEIPLDHPTTNPIAPACDFLCHLAEQDLQIETV